MCVCVCCFCARLFSIVLIFQIRAKDSCFFTLKCFDDSVHHFKVSPKNDPEATRKVRLIKKNNNNKRLHRLLSLFDKVVKFCIAMCPSKSFSGFVVEGSTCSTNEWWDERRRTNQAPPLYHAASVREAEELKRSGNVAQCSFVTSRRWHPLNKKLNSPLVSTTTLF